MHAQYNAPRAGRRQRLPCRIETMFRKHIILAVLSMAGGVDAAIASGDSEWQFDSWAGPAIAVRTFVPDGAVDTMPIVIVMHGWSREAKRYFSDWRELGTAHGFIVVVPHFPVEDFPSSKHYNLGHVFDEKTGKKRPEAEWTFAAIEPLFDEVVARIGGKQTQYTLFGHSAGSQFVHRFLYYMPEVRVRRYIAANAGWYTMPDFDTEYPYGLNRASIDKDQLIAAFEKDMVLLIGREDVDYTDPNLRKTREANRQGKNRFARGLTMFYVAKVNAGKLGADLKWRLMIVEEAGHINAQMAPAAAQLVE